MKRWMLIAAFAGVCAGQNAARAQFDVVSVRVDREGTGGAGDKFPQHGTWKWTRIPLSFLVMYAYHVSLQQFAGIPEAFQQQDMAFDVTAKMPAEATHEQFRRMLQAMLEDRFHLVIHREMRQFPVVTIELAKGGAKLKPAAGNCAPPAAATIPPEQHRCGEIVPLVNFDRETAIWEYIGWSVSMADLAETLGANGPVVDDTRIEGQFDMDVTVQYAVQPQTDDAGEKLARQAEDNRRFRAAFEKELGLTIDLGKTAKRPIPVIVVDHVEMPTPN